jgi:alkanesulfonate monooxygenase SsuD/methylene tetrahydromethanopterin reductase-like flavin-dependent oxidoreductase (luciferase family)
MTETGAAPMPVKFGLQLWSQQTDWPTFRDAALAAERNGWDSVWTWDHLLAIFGPWEQPILEGWSVLAALGPITTRVRLGLMVGANTFRNPGVTTKLATTLDHVSSGRAVVGIGAAWFQREHEAFGIDFGASPGERIDWLDEAVMLMRRLLDGGRVDHDGPHYAMSDALCEPRPVQPHLPILIGGSGRQKTLRVVAERADGWNTSGSYDNVVDALRTLERHCADIGRDPATIEKTVSFPIILRDDAAAADARTRELLNGNGVFDTDDFGEYLAGTPSQVGDTLATYRDLGFETFIVRMPAPFDQETIERMPEVAALLVR